VDEYFHLWQLVAGLDWKVLLNGGGILDQDELMLENILNIEARKRQFEAHQKVNEANI
jgi:hypothetical protein